MSRIIFVLIANKTSLQSCIFKDQIRGSLQTPFTFTNFGKVLGKLLFFLVLYL